MWTRRWQFRPDTCAKDFGHWSHTNGLNDRDEIRIGIRWKILKIKQFYRSLVWIRKWNSRLVFLLNPLLQTPQKNRFPSFVWVFRWRATASLLGNRRPHTSHATFVVRDSIDSKSSRYSLLISMLAKLVVPPGLSTLSGDWFCELIVPPWTCFRWYEYCLSPINVFLHSIHLMGLKWSRTCDWNFPLSLNFIVQSVHLNWKDCDAGHEVVGSEQLGIGKSTKCYVYDDNNVVIVQQTYLLSHLGKRKVEFLCFANEQFFRNLRSSFQNNLILYSELYVLFTNINPSAIQKKNIQCVTVIAVIAGSHERKIKFPREIIKNHSISSKNFST